MCSVIIIVGIVSGNNDSRRLSPPILQRGPGHEPFKVTVTVTHDVSHEVVRLCPV